MNWVLVVAAAAFMLDACTTSPQFAPLLPDFYPPQAEMISAPFVLVGKVESSAPVGPYQRGIRGQILQLNLAMISVENVLSGRLEDNRIAVYYFSPAPVGGWDGPPPLYLVRATRLILFLRRDGGVFRTVSDYWNCTIEVYSGAHPGYRADPNKALGREIGEILLNPAVGSSSLRDVVFSSEMLIPEGYLIERLEKLSTNGDVRARLAACRILASLS